MFFTTFVLIAFFLIATITCLLFFARFAGTFGARSPLVAAGRAVFLYLILCIAWPTSSGVRSSFTFPFAT
jgi:hypothetical protein